METWLLIINLSVTATLFGLIWVVQLVHYPGFAFIDAHDFHTFHTLHTRNIGFFVAPLMVLELILAMALVIIFSYGLLFWGHLILTLGLWGSTFFIQVPMHARLAHGKDKNVIRRLTLSNWIRTLLWTFKFLLALYLIFYTPAVV
ncbi:MAG TPA: hypothetical protein VJ917_12000 [Saprospiraceae bacterium]|nr:hypothetical protein [Saprospiraceae bacterium]